MIGHLWIWISVQSALRFLLPDFRFLIFRISETRNIILYFNNVHLSDCRLFLFHIGKRRFEMVFDWIIDSRFVICLNFLFPTYKYYDRTFMNFDLCTIKFRPLSDFRFPIFRILVYLFDCRLFLFHIGKRRFHMDFDWMMISRFVISLNFLFPI